MTLEENSTIDYRCHKYELLNHNGTCTKNDFDLSNFSICSEWDYEKPKSFVAQVSSS